MCNETFASLSGYSKTDVEGKLKWDMFFPEGENKDIVREYDAEFSKTALEPLRIDIGFLNKTGVRKEIHLIIAVIPDHSAKVMSLLDITRRKQAEGELRRHRDHLEELIEERTLELKTSEQRFKDIAESSSDWIWEINRRGLFSFVSKRITDVMGYSPEEIVGQSPLDLMPPEQVEQTRLVMINAVKNRMRIKNLENWSLHKNGSRVCLLTNGTPFFNDGGDLRGYRGVAVDITEQKRIEKQLQDAQAEAIRANNAKSVFLANMSHDLRTPLNAVTGFSELLTSMVTDKKQKNYLNAIQSAGKSLLDLINDILDLSKIEAEQIEIKHAPISLNHLFNEIEQIFKLTISGKGLRFVIELSDDLPSMLYLDELRVKQILLNLIGNAVKLRKKEPLKFMPNVKI